MSGSQTILVYGNSLYGQGYRFVHNGVDYTPLSSTAEYDEYILTANGSYVIYVDGQVYMSFSVTGITMPQSLSGTVRGWLAGNTGYDDLSDGAAADSGCLNYPHVVSLAKPYLLVRVEFVEGATIDQALFSVSGATVAYSETSEGNMLYWLQPTADAPITLSYDGYIVYVGNYSS